MPKNPGQGPPQQERLFEEPAAGQIPRQIPDFSGVKNFPSSEHAHRLEEEKRRDRLAKQGMNEAVADLGKEAVGGVTQPSNKKTPKISKPKSRRRGYPRRDPDYGAEPWNLQ